MALLANASFMGVATFSQFDDEFRLFLSQSVLGNKIETSGKGTSDWFENQFIRCFPDFLRWREKKEGSTEEEYIPASSKVA